MQAAGLPTSWLISATIGAAIGFSLIEFGMRKSPGERPVSAGRF